MCSLRRAVHPPERPRHVRLRPVSAGASSETQPRVCSAPSEPGATGEAVCRVVPSEPRSGAREGGIAGPWFITPHAVHRYRERIRGGIPYERALGELVEHSKRAHLVKLRPDGVEEWRNGKPWRLRFRVHRGVLLTVLPSHDGWVERRR